MSIPWHTLPAATLAERVQAALARRRFGPETTAYRLIQGNREGLPGLLVDALGPVTLLQTQGDAPSSALEPLAARLPGQAVYWKRLSQEDKAAPALLRGTPSPAPLLVRESGITYELDLAAGYSQGLFLDQRENRARVRDLSAGGGRVLNTFAYTCAFSLAAALGGAGEVLSLDLSRPSLDWGKRNFAHNGLDPELPTHDFLAGDVFHWLERFVKKARQFDLVILDPPTFSRTKEGRVFRVERDYPALVELAARLLPPRAAGRGHLLCCTNQASLTPARFRELVTTGLHQAARPDLARALSTPPLPEDFAEDDSMKNVWAG
jgi:23S rRNA (cytosine1962-C5)-methyltransferase